MNGGKEVKLLNWFCLFFCFQETKKKKWLLPSLRHQRKTKSLKGHRYYVTLLAQRHRGKEPPLNLPDLTVCSLSHARDTGKGLPGKEWKSMKTTTNRKPKYRTVTKVPKPFQTNMLGAGKKHHRAPTSDLDNIEDKILIKKSCCSRSQDGVFRLGGRWPHVSPVWSSVSAICDSS